MCHVEWMGVALSLFEMYSKGFQGLIFMKWEKSEKYNWNFWKV